MITRKSNLLILISLMFVFRILLEISYVNIISRVFLYEGFSFNFNLIQYFSSWLLFVSALFLIRSKIYRVSDYFFLTAILAIVAPITIIYGYDSGRSVFPVVASISALLVIFLISNMKFISFKTIPTFESGLLSAVLISVFFVLFLILWYPVSGASFNLDLSKVYEYRSDNADLASRGILAYTNNWTFRVFNIVLFCVSLMYRRYVWMVLFFIVQIYLFAYSGHKSVLFFPFMIIGIWYYFGKSNSSTLLPVMFSVVILLTLVSFYLWDDLWATTLFSRRVFFVPARLTYAYFDFFSSYPHVFWSNSILSGFIDYPYSLPVSLVVGRFVGAEGMAANNGYIASGFAHAGLLGVLLYSFLIGFLLKFLNDVTENMLPLWFAISLSIIPLRSLLISSDLFTVMLTHGFGVAIIIILLLRAKNYVTR